MIVTKLSTSPAGSPTDLQRQEITSPIGDPPLRIFRRTLHFGIATDGLAEGVEVEPGAAAVLRATFAAFDYDALSVPESALRATRSARSGGVLIQLDAPRRITQVTLSATRAGPGSKLEFYRLDGDTPAGEPTASVARQTDVVVAQKSVEFAGTPRRAARAPIAPQPDTVLEDQTILDHAFLLSSAVFPVDFTDARFLLRLVSSTGSAISLGTTDVESVGVRGYPTNPRIGLAVAENPGDSADPATAAFFWRADGEVGNGTPTSQGIVDAGEALGEELARALPRFAERLAEEAESGPPPHFPASIPVALVLESDAPCILNPPASGPAFRLEHHSVRRSFADGSPKRVLRFDGERSGRYDIPLALPGGAALRTAALEMDVSVAGDRSASGSASAGVAGAGAAGGAVGMRVTVDRPAAQRVQLSEALSVSSVAVAVMGSSAGVEAVLELREDAGGVPEGRLLAEGRFTPGRPGAIGWSAITLPEPAVVSTAAHWIVLRARAGSLVWIAAPDGGGLLSSVEAGGWAESGDPSLSALHDLRTRAGAAATALPSLEFIVAGAAAPLVPLEDSRYSVELGTLAQPPVSAATPGDIVTVTATVVGSARGVVTLYPPRVVYD